MAIGNRPEVDFDQDIGSGSQTYYYNRDGSSSSIIIITGDYLFTNFPSGAGEITLDKNRYPFVKIDNTYYINDGEKWSYLDGRNSASMMSILFTYQWDNGTKVFEQLPSFSIKNTPEETNIVDYNKDIQLKKFTPNNFKINNKYFEVYTYKSRQRETQRDGNFIGEDIWNNNNKLIPKFGAKSPGIFIPLWTNEYEKIKDNTTTKLSVTGNIVKIGSSSWELPENARLIIVRKTPFFSKIMRDIQIIHSSINTFYENWASTYVKQGLNSYRESGVLSVQASDSGIGFFDKSSSYLFLGTIGFALSERASNNPTQPDLGDPSTQGLFVANVDYKLHMASINIAQDITLSFSPTSSLSTLDWIDVSNSIKYGGSFNANGVSFTDKAVNLMHYFQHPSHSSKSDYAFLKYDAVKYSYINGYYRPNNNDSYTLVVNTSSSSLCAITTRVVRPSCFKDYFSYTNDFHLDLAIEGGPVTSSIQPVSREKNERWESSYLNVEWKTSANNYVGFIPTFNESVLRGVATSNKTKELWTRNNKWETLPYDYEYYDGKSGTFSRTYSRCRFISETLTYGYWVIAFVPAYDIKPSPITYTHKVVNDTLIFTFTNPNETDLIIKAGSAYGLFDESTWGKIPSNSSGNFEIPTITNILHYTTDPYIEYYDPYEWKTIKIYLKDI